MLKRTSISLDEDFSAGVLIPLFGCTLGQQGVGKGVDKALGSFISSTADVEFEYCRVRHDGEDEWDSFSDG
jgi:hypothetical protein